MKWTLRPSLLPLIRPELKLLTRASDAVAAGRTPGSWFAFLISQMERAAGFGHADTVQSKLDKLHALLAQSYTPPQDAALLAEMLSLPNDGCYPALELTSPKRRQKTLETLVSQVTTLARQNPLLMIFEDAHWADPTRSTAGQTPVYR